MADPATRTPTGGRGALWGGALLLVAAAALVVFGLLQAQPYLYYPGLALLPFAAVLLLRPVRFFRATPAAVSLFVVVAVVVAGVGVWLPQRALDAEFTGQNVAWRYEDATAGSSPGFGAASTALVALRYQDEVVLLSAADGRPLNTISVDANDSLLPAGENLLVEPGPATEMSFRFYDADGRLRWERVAPPSRFARGLAHADGITVIETCPELCVREGVDLDGNTVWTSEPGPFLTPPTHTLPRTNRPLPPLAFWGDPDAGDGRCPCGWTFVTPADGRPVLTATGSAGQVVADAVGGPVAVVVDTTTGTFAAARADGSTMSGSADLRDDELLAAGPYLLGADRWGQITAVEPTAAEPVTTTEVPFPAGSWDTRGANDVGLTGAGVGRLDRSALSITGYGATSPTWTRPAEDGTGAVFGRTTVVELTRLGRTSPVEPLVIALDDGAMDRRVVVLDAATGAEIGRVRTRWLPSVYPVAGGAVLITDGTVLLIGSV